MYRHTKDLRGYFSTDSFLSGVGRQLVVAIGIGR